MGVSDWKYLYNKPCEKMATPFVGLRATDYEFMVYGVDDARDTVAVAMTRAQATMGTMRLVSQLMRRVLGDTPEIEADLMAVGAMIEHQLLGTKRERVDVDA